MQHTIYHLTRRTGTTAALVLLMIMGLAGINIGVAQDTTRLQVIKNVPIVEGTINGIPAYFLIDTGSTITVLNESLAHDYNFSVVKNRFLNNRCVIGMGGRCYLKEARHVTVGLGSLHLEFVNKSADLTLLSDQFASKGITIAGIIGNDLLCFLGSRIDLRSRTIVFKPDNAPIPAGKMAVATADIK
jgi:Aspartyl protease